MNRFRQVVHYAWKQSKAIASQTQKSRYALFLDMIRCYQKYRMWTNQYIKEKFYVLMMTFYEKLNWYKLLKYKINGISNLRSV